MNCDSELEMKILTLMQELCPDFAVYNFLKKYDLYKGSLFGGTNIYYKVGENNLRGMVTTKRNIRLYGLEKFTYNFQTCSDRKGTYQNGWSGETLLQLLIYLKNLNIEQNGKFD